MRQHVASTVNLHEGTIKQQLLADLTLTMNKLCVLSLIVASCYAHSEDNLTGTQPETLVSNAISIEEIIVTSEGLTEFKSPMITPATINQPDSAALLKSLPGANINSNGPITGIAQYRGLHGDRIAVTMENEAVLSGGPNAMDSPLSYAPPLLLKALELSTGVASVADSQEAIGGLLQAKLDRGKFADTHDLELSSSIISRYGSIDDGKNSALKAVAANNRHKLAVLGSFDEGGNAENGDGKTLFDTGYRRERYDLSYAWQNAANGAQLSLGKLDTTDTGTPALPMDIQDIDTDIANFNGVTEYGSATLRARVGYRHVYHLMDNFSLRTNNNPMAFRQNKAIGKQVSWGTSIELPITNGNKLMLGIDSTTTVHDALITNPNTTMFKVKNFADAERDIYGLFAQWDGSRGLWEIETGLRYNRVNMDSNEIFATGMMSAMQTAANTLSTNFNSANRDQAFNNIDIVVKAHRPLNDTTELNIGLGRKTRSPSYQELYLWLPLESTGGLADGRTYIGNLDLDSEINHEITLGLDWAENGFYAGGQVFFRKVDDFIQGTPSDNMTANMLSVMMGQLAPLQFNNINAQLYGFDGRYGLILDDTWRLDGVISVVRGRDKDNNDNLYRIAPLNHRLTLTWQEDRLSANLESVLYARQTDTSTYNDEQKTSGYGLLNLYGQYRVSAGLRINAGIENLLDKNYTDSLSGYNRNEDSDIPVGDRLPGRGRNLFASVAMSW